MGLVQSQVCVNLAMLPPDVWAQVQAEDFTVQRNSKESGGPKTGDPGCAEETGWCIQQKIHSACCTGHDAKTGPTESDELGEAVATKYAKGDNDVWRVFMNNGWNKGFHQHACGWRKCDPSVRTFWPTRCKTPMEREAWWTWFDAQLNSLPTWSEVVHKRMVAEGKLPPFKKEVHEVSPPPSTPFHPATI
jgi:hypothetical protein